MTRGTGWRLACLSLVVLGFALSGYLLARSFALRTGRDNDVIDVCSAVFGVSCDRALVYSSSWQLGIPLAGWGLVYYGTLACLLVLAWSLGEAFELKATLGALLLAATGACGSVVLAAMVVTGEVPLCPLCMMAHAINLVLVPALYRLSGRTARQLLQSLRAGGRYLLGGQTDAPLEARWALLGFVNATLVAIVIYQWVLVESERWAATPPGSTLDPQRVLATYASTPKLDVTIDADDPRLGSADVPAVLIVFSDFQCPACREFAHEISHLTDHFAGKLTVIFKHYPLGTACNTAVSVDRHPRACEAAWAAEAARRQGNFWPFHDGLFASDLDASEETLQRIAQEAGLNMVQFEVDRRAQATRQKILSDINTGSRLGVRGTPSVFLNGRRLNNRSRSVLQLLIHREIESAGL